MTVKTVYLGRDNPTVVTFYKSGEVIDFSVMDRYIVKFRENDLIVDTDELAFSGLISGTNQGVVSFNFSELNIEAGTYTLEFTAYDPLHDDGQIIVDYDHDLKFRFIADYDFDLVVQNDSGTETNANSYIDIAYFKSYHRPRGNNFHIADDFEIKQALVRATDYLDIRFQFVSSKSTETQNTQWPRYGYDIIPRAIKEAVAEYAFRALSVNLNPDPENLSGGRLVKKKSEGITPISESIEYEESSGVFQMPDYPAADEKIRRAGLIQNSSTRFLMRG
jgi:hypothetical protein